MSYLNRKEKSYGCIFTEHEFRGGIDLNKEYAPINGGIVDYHNPIQINVKKGDIILYSTYASMDSDFEPLAEHIENGNNRALFPKHPSLSRLLPGFVVYSGTYFGTGKATTGYYCTKDKQVAMGVGMNPASYIQLRKTSSYLPIYTHDCTLSMSSTTYINSSNGLEILLFGTSPNCTAGRSGAGGEWLTPATYLHYCSYDPSCDRFFGNATSNAGNFNAYVLNIGDGLTFSTTYYYALKRYQLPTS